MWLGSFFMLTKRVLRDRSFDKHRTRRIGQFSCTGTPCSFYSNPRKYCKKFSTAERELLRHRFSSYPGTPSNLFLAIRAQQHCLFCIIFGSCYRKLCSYAALLYFVISSSTLSRSEIFPVFTSSSICTQSLTAAFNSSAAYWRDMGI